MDRNSRRASPDLEERYTQAHMAWQHALAQYLTLAREGAGAAKLRAAAAAVHAAALQKGRLTPDEDHER